VVALSADVTDSGRAAYVGPDDRQAGRLAGDLMGRFLGPVGGHIIMIAGLFGLRGHREREAGFRGVLAEFYPECTLVDVLETREVPERAGLLAQRAFDADPELRGIYHNTTGALPVVQALRRLGRLGDTALIVHELTESRRALLRERSIDALIDQNPALEAQVAVEIMARLLGRLPGEAVTTMTELRIYIPENA
jgi:LacI family transcriptional regulator